MRRRRSLFPAVRHALLLAWLAVTLFPIYWMLITSFKRPAEWVTWPPRWFPHEPTLENYVKVLTPGTSTFDRSRSTTASRSGCCGAA